MTKKELIKAVASENGEFTVTEIEKLVESVLGTIKSELAKGEKVSLYQFGNFEVVERPEREGRNPQTGEPMIFKASKAPKFKPAKALKDAVNA